MDSVRVIVRIRVKAIVKFRARVRNTWLVL